MKYEAIIQIPQQELDKWQELLDMKYIDFDEFKMSRSMCHEYYTARFEDGMQADIKVCSANYFFWIDSTLYNKYGEDVAYGKLFDINKVGKYKLPGEYKFRYKKNTYLVKVVAK